MALKTLPVLRMPALPASQDAPPAHRLNTTQRHKQESLVTVMRYVRTLRTDLGTDTLGPACARFHEQFAAGLLPAAVLAALSVLQPGKANRCPSRATLYRWDRGYAAYLRGDSTAAAPRYKGGVRREYGWEARALEVYHIPSAPLPGAVADQLQREGWDSATEARVRRYLKSLPATLGPNSPQRLGRHYHRLNKGHYIERDTSVLQVGELYSMDGHTVDVYLAHPQSGGIWRPEFTAVMDIASRYIPGWYLSEAESKHSTILALSHALTTQDHVPGWLHIDNGSGFKARAMSQEADGYYARFSIQPMFSIPGNSKGRGHIERFFRTVRDKHDKLFADGMFYCGDDMAPEINRRLSAQLTQGKRSLPSFYAYRDSLAAWIDHYNHTPHSALGGRTPAEVWAEGLVRVPLELPEHATIRERAQRTVRRGRITLDKRSYTDAVLALYNDRAVAVEYSIHDDAHVWVYDEQDRLICIAELRDKVAYLPSSRLEEQREKRKAGQMRRIAKRAAEVEAQHRANLTHDQHLADLEVLMDAPAPCLPPQKNTADSEEPAAQDAVPGFDNFDPYDTDY